MSTLSRRKMISSAEKKETLKIDVSFTVELTPSELIKLCKRATDLGYSDKLAFDLIRRLLIENGKSELINVQEN